MMSLKVDECKPLDNGVMPADRLVYLMAIKMNPMVGRSRLNLSNPR
jgi:hypothetical protein